MYDVIIIGGGVSGMGAAIYAARFNLKTLILAKRKGGLIQDTHLVENYPGVKKWSGLEMVNAFEEHVDDYEDMVDLKEEEVVDIEKDKNGFKVKTKDNSYECKTIIYATGTRRRKLNVPGEEEFANKGVSYCGLCDGPIYKDKIVGVVGGSDSAAKESLLLAEYAKKVYIIYRKDKIRAEPINLKRVEANKKIEIINNANVREIKGDKMLGRVILDREYNNSKELKLDGLFIEIGHIVESDLAKKLGVKVNEKDEIIINENSETNIVGFFAAGDVANREFKQAITGVAEGVIAAFSAFKYIKEEEDYGVDAK